MSDSKLSLTWEHAKTSYAHAQDVIKFLDPKIGAIIGLLSLSSVFPLMILQWIASRDAKQAFSLADICMRSEAGCELLVGSTILGAATGALGIIFATQGIIARKPPQHLRSLKAMISDFVHSLRGKKSIVSPRLSFLFPIHDPADRAAAQAFFPRLAEGMTRKQIVEEYAFQLEQLGAIIFRKLHYVRRAIHVLQLQMLIYVIGLGTSYLLLRG